MYAENQYVHIDNYTGEKTTKTKIIAKNNQS